MPLATRLAASLLVLAAAGAAPAAVLPARLRPHQRLDTISGLLEVQLITSSGRARQGSTFSLPFLQNDGVTFKDKAD